MKSVGFSKVSLNTVLKYLEANDIAEEISKTISTTHMVDFRFSDKYVMKKIKAFEFMLYTQLIHNPNPTQKKFYSTLPEIYGLVYDPESDNCYIVMENFNPSNTCSEIEIKVGRYNYLPTHFEEKQISKFRNSFILGSIDDDYRVCMLARRDKSGNIVEKKRIEKVSGVKQRVTPNSLELLLKPYSEEEADSEFLKEAIAYYEQQLLLLIEIFEKELNELGFMITAASLMFLLDYKNKSYRLLFIDFGCCAPCSRMDIWPTEQLQAFKSVLADLRRCRDKLFPQTPVPAKEPEVANPTS